jgi:hypothetical protein
MIILPQLNFQCWVVGSGGGGGGGGDGAAVGELQHQSITNTPL